MHTKYRIAVLLVIVVGMLSSCSNPSTPSPTATSPVTSSPTATRTAIPTATEPPTATATTTPTATATPTATPEPTATFTPQPTATPKHTATPKPTEAPPTPVVFVPPPQVFPFDVGGFMQYLDYAHTEYQEFLRGFGGAVKGDYTGNCGWLFQARGELLGIVAFSGAPEPWLSMVNEYHSLREQAIVIIEPVHVVCQAGGGVVPAGIDRQIVDFFDMAQNRMYEMLQQARAMTP